MGMKIEWNPKTIVIKKLIDVLYSLPGCSLGGAAHVVIEDGNIRDSDLEYVEKTSMLCPEDIDSELSFLIVAMLSQLSIEQRAAVLTINEGYYILNEADWNHHVEKNETKIRNLLDSQIKS